MQCTLDTQFTTHAKLSRSIGAGIAAIWRDRTRLKCNARLVVVFHGSTSNHFKLLVSGFPRTSKRLNRHTLQVFAVTSNTVAKMIRHVRVAIVTVVTTCIVLNNTIHFTIQTRNTETVIIVNWAVEHKLSFFTRLRIVAKLYFHFLFIGRKL